MNISLKHLALSAFMTPVVALDPSIANAVEIKVFCSNGIKAVMEELVPQFERATQHKVVITYGLSAVLKRQIEAGAAFDIAVLTPPLIDDLIRQGKIVQDTRVTVARSGMALAIRAGAARSDIRTTDALKRALLTANPSVTRKKARAVCSSLISCRNSTWRRP